MNEQPIVLEPEKIFIRNLPLHTTREEVFRLFGTIGPLTGVYLPKQKLESDHWFGFVGFQSESDAVRAVQQYNGFEFLNHKGFKTTLIIGKAFQRRTKSFVSSPRVSSGYGTQEILEEINAPSPGISTQGLDDMAASAPEWIEERDMLLQIIDDNDIKIQDLQKKKSLKDKEDLLLDEKEKKLQEELNRLPGKIEMLKTEIEVLQLQVKLKKLQAEQEAIIQQ